VVRWKKRGVWGWAKVGKAAALLYIKSNRATSAGSIGLIVL